MYSQDCWVLRTIGAGSSRGQRRHPGVLLHYPYLASIQIDAPLARPQDSRKPMQQLISLHNLKSFFFLVSFFKDLILVY